MHLSNFEYLVELTNLLLDAFHRKVRGFQDKKKPTLHSDIKNSAAA